MSTAAIIEGVRFADQRMVDLVREAMEQGFRFEAGTNKRHATETGFTLYPPDEQHAPIRAGCGEVSPRHLANVKRSLVRAGFVPTDDKETNMGRAEDRQRARQARNEGAAVVDIRAMPEDERGAFATYVIEKIGSEAGLPPDLAALLAMMLPLLEVHRDERGDLMSDHAELDAAKAEAEEALRHATEAEERAVAAERNLETAKKDAGLLAARVKETEARLEASKAEVRKLRAAIEPFKALLAETDS